MPIFPHTTQEIINILYPLVAGGVIGYISGVRTTLYTDRRKEFNAATEEVRKSVKSQIEAIENGLDSGRGVAYDDLKSITEYIAAHKAKKYDNYCNKYNEEFIKKHEVNYAGYYVFVGDTHLVLSILIKIYSFIKRR